MYDNNNVFAKIINSEISAKKLYEDDKLIAINDINPAAPIHILVIPKGEYMDYEDFVNKASIEDISHYFKVISMLAKKNDIRDYRLVTNKGSGAGQSVFHFHTHILSGSNNNSLIDENL